MKYEVKIEISQLIAQMFQAGAVKGKHDLLLVVVQVNQSKTTTRIPEL